MHDLHTAIATAFELGWFSSYREAISYFKSRSMDRRKDHYDPDKDVFLYQSMTDLLKENSFNKVSVYTNSSLVMNRLGSPQLKSATVLQWLKDRKTEKSTQKYLIYACNFNKPHQNWSAAEWLLIDGYQMANYRGRVPKFVADGNFGYYFVCDAYEVKQT